MSADYTNLIFPNHANMGHFFEPLYMKIECLTTMQHPHSVVQSASCTKMAVTDHWHHFLHLESHDVRQLASDMAMSSKVCSVCLNSTYDNNICCLCDGSVCKGYIMLPEIPKFTNVRFACPSCYPGKMPYKV